MELATFKFGVGIRRTITTKKKKINEKETGKISKKFPKKIVSSKKKLKRKSQRATERAKGQSDRKEPYKDTSGS